LIYIGIKSLLAKNKVAEIKKDETSHIEQKSFQVFLQGFLCNLLNPKAIMFIVAFFTLIINPSISIAAQFGYGFEVALIHLVWFSGLAMMITHQRVKKGINKIQHYVIKVMGVALIAFGARIAMLSNT
jgi:threonine/homoserine/homoserine lactone efflux protein